MRVDAYCAAVAGQLTTAQQATLWMLSSYVNRHTGETFVSIPTLAERMGIHFRKVREHISALVEKGIIHADYRSGRSTMYRLPLHPSTEYDEAATPAEIGPGNPGRNRPRSDIHTPAVNGRGQPADTPADIGPHPGRLVHKPRPKSAAVTSNNHVHNQRADPVDEQIPARADDAPVDISDDIYARIGHHLGPEFKPRRGHRAPTDAEPDGQDRARALYAEFGYGS